MKKCSKHVTSAVTENEVAAVFWDVTVQINKEIKASKPNVLLTSKTKKTRFLMFEPRWQAEKLWCWNLEIWKWENVERERCNSVHSARLGTSEQKRCRRSLLCSDPWSIQWIFTSFSPMWAKGQSLWSPHKIRITIMMVVLMWAFEHGHLLRTECAHF